MKIYYNKNFTLYGIYYRPEIRQAMQLCMFRTQVEGEHTHTHTHYNSQFLTNSQKWYGNLFG